jgi:protease-4
MKSFFGSFFGALFAILLLVGLCVLGLVTVLLVVGSSEKATAIPARSLLVLDLSQPIRDAPPEFDPSQLLAGMNDGQQSEHVSLRDVLQAVEHAAADPSIKGVFITGNMPLDRGYGSSFAALKEVRQTLLKFKESHKPVYSYLQFPFTSEYYVASVADQIFVDPQAEFILRGPSFSSLYFASALKKFGVGVQVSRVGKYKSAVEPFIRDNMSPESREQIEKVFADVWRDTATAIEQSRGLPAGSLEQLINANGIINSDVAIKSKLGTEVVSLSQIMDRFKQQYGTDAEHNTFNQVSVNSYLESVDRDQKKSNAAGSRIGVVYAEGEIVDGEGLATNVGGDRYAREIRKLRFDPRVKAIVLRVNSPGGSAFASEQIYRELKAAGEMKPVIVSMGGYAASGGYYISAPAKHIFAEPNTITGSIGVFDLLVNFEKLATDNGITTESVTTTTPLATLFDPFKQKSDEDLAIMQRETDRFYDGFLGRVADGRHLSIEQVNDIAQGRVWSGSDATRLKLVDEIGGLTSAIAYAAKEANLGDHPSITEYPSRKDLSDKLKELFKSTVRPPVARFDPVELGVQKLEQQLIDLRALNDPNGIYARFPADIIWN